MSRSVLHAPSSAARRLQCPGSARAEAAEPDDESPHAREGSAAHWVVEQRVQHGVIVPVGTLAPNGEPVTQEMAEGADLMAGYLVRIQQEHRFTAAHVEQPVSCRRIHPECFGPPDFFGVTDGYMVHLVDYEFGHLPIDPFENAQLVEYLSGVLDFLKLSDTVYVCFAICQPRAYSGDAAIREWRVRASDLRGLWNKLAAAEEEAESATPRHITGPECRYCRARWPCAALRGAAAGVMDFSTQQQPRALPIEAASLELRMIAEAADLLKFRREALEAQVDAALRAGQRAPHHQLVPGKPSPLKWTRPAAEVAALGKLFGVELLRPAEPITPNQALKLIAAPVISAYSERTPAGLKLAEISATEARRVFYTR